MSTQIPTSGAEQSPLGKPVSYRSDYAPELLFPIPRQGKRDELGIAAGSLPFVGEDLWNAYELSWLDARGKPVVALGELRVPAASPSLIESKSLKLYFNSFNQTRFGDTAEVQATVSRDLSAAAGATVGVLIAPLASHPRRVLSWPEGELIDGQEIDVEAYEPAPGQLRCTDGPARQETLVSQLLKSNCLVTGQPDWGTLFVRYRGAPIDREGLLRYVIGFRNHNEFHEQCVERVFMDIQRRCQPEHLEVWARYTRRGGLDINPWRSSTPGTAPANQGDPRQ